MPVLELDLGQWCGVCGAVDQVHDLCNLAVDPWKPVGCREPVARNAVFGARPLSL